jgi:peptide deformylase
VTTAVDLPDSTPFRILTWPADAHLLRRKAREVRADEFDTEPLRNFARALAMTMMLRNGAGLASTQVKESPGGGELWAIIVIRRTSQPDAFSVMCNPVVMHVASWETGHEGCLSFSSVQEELTAPDRMIVRAQRLDGTSSPALFDGIEARAVFHEVEHLHGRVLVDRMGTLQRKLFMKRVVKARAK